MFVLGNTFEKIGFAVPSPNHCGLDIVRDSSETLLDFIGSINPPSVEELPVLVSLCDKNMYID